MHIIPLAAEKIEKKILNIPDHWGEVADQAFDPDSIHAQSGIAVAEALENTLQFTEQALDAEKQAQARENIGAVSEDDVDDKLIAVAYIDTEDNENVEEIEGELISNAELNALFAALEG